MKKRIIIGSVLLLVAAVIFALRLYVTSYVLDVLILSLSIGGTCEISIMLKKANKSTSLLIPVLFASLTYTTIILAIIFNINIYLTLLIILATLVLLSAISLIVQSFNKNFKRFSKHTVINCIYPNILFLPLYLINHLTVFSDKILGNDLVAVFFCLLIFLVAICTDTFAYFVGRTLKGPKLAPKISPNKTISGAIGGLFGGLCAGLILYIIFNYILDLTPIFVSCNINFLSVILLSIILSVFSQAGDLFASYIKRLHGIKDYSKLFDEQGGIMDRFDGESFVAPICLIFILIFVI